MTVRILVGDVRDRLRDLPDESVQCVVTSPPYWGLRDYGVSGQLGLERTPDEYVARMVAVFREVRRVLRDDGTLWLNVGDSYCAHEGQRKVTDIAGPKQQTKRGSTGSPSRHVEGMKAKDLVGIPWMLAFALRADGWYLRSDIIWHKPNPMPESVTDRPTKAHEYVFLLSKSATYFYDADAIAEPATSADEIRWEGNYDDQGSITHADTNAGRRTKRFGKSGNKARKSAADRGVPVADNGTTNGAVAGSVPWEGVTRNKRSVWTVPTAPFSEAHFATFPPDLIEPCILAGAPKGGVVLDPFGGAGTTALVADRHHRDAVLIELNPEYAAMAERRLHKDAGMFADVHLDRTGTA